MVKGHSWADQDDGRLAVVRWSCQSSTRLRCFRDQVGLVESSDHARARRPRHTGQPASSTQSFSRPAARASSRACLHLLFRRLRDRSTIFDIVFDALQICCSREGRQGAHSQHSGQSQHLLQHRGSQSSVTTLTEPLPSGDRRAPAKTTKQAASSGARYFGAAACKQAMIPQQLCTSLLRHCLSCPRDGPTQRLRHVE